MDIALGDLTLETYVAIGTFAILILYVVAKS